MTSLQHTSVDTSESKVFVSLFFIAVFRFCAILEVMEMQLQSVLVLTFTDLVQLI